MAISAEEKKSNFSKTHSHFQSSRQILDQNEAWSQVQRSSAQPPAAASTSTQTHTTCPCAEGLLGFPICFFFFFLNLCIQKSLSLSILCSSTWYTEHGLFTQKRKRKVSNNWAPLEAGQWGTKSRAGHQEPGWDLSSWEHTRSDVPVLNRSSYTTKSPFLIFFVFISFHIGMRPP